RVSRIEEDGANREVCGRHARPRSSIARTIRYTSPVLALGLLARWIHLATPIFLVGGAVMIAMAGQSDRPTARRWERRTLAVTRALAVVALGSGLVVLSVQTALFEGRPRAAPALCAIPRGVVA